MYAILRRVIRAYATAVACGLMIAAGAITTTAADSFAVAIHVDAAQTKGPLQPIWRFFGADEPNYAYMQNGRKLV